MVAERTIRNVNASTGTSGHHLEVVRQEGVVEEPESPVTIPELRVSWSDDERRCHQLILDTQLVAVDLETTGLHPHHRSDAQIGAIILRTGSEHFIFRSLPRWWNEVLASPDIQKIGHNLKFDLMWMIAASDEPVVARNLRDTMLMSQLVEEYRTPSGAKKAGNPGAYNSNALAACLERHLGVTISKSIDHESTDWTGVWSDSMVEYMLEDIAYLPRLNDVLYSTLTEQGQEYAADIENDAVLASAWMTYNGFRPDPFTWEQSIKDWTAEMILLLGQLMEMWPGVENFNSPKQILEGYTRIFGTKIPNTRKETLKQLALDHPQIEALMQQRHLQTRLKNWGLGFLGKHTCTVCGRFHPEWRQIGTETSRYSCSAPNLQQIPRDPKFRAMFVSDPGCSLVSLDYSAIEVLVAAVYAGDQNLIQACATGDPHRATAERIVGHPVEKHSSERQNAKIANFGLLFGGGAEGLVRQARDLFNTKITLEEAKEIIAKYYKLYPNLMIEKRLAWAATYGQDSPKIEVANKIGFRRTLERLNLKSTTYLNTRIQSLAGYGLKRSFMYLREAGLLPSLVAQVHDELVFEFLDEEIDDCWPLAQECMIRGMQDVLGRNVPVTVEEKIGKVWLK